MRHHHPVAGDESDFDPRARHHVAEGAGNPLGNSVVAVGDHDLAEPPDEIILAPPATVDLERIPFAGGLEGEAFRRAIAVAPGGSRRTSQLFAIGRVEAKFHRRGLAPEPFLVAGVGTSHAIGAVGDRDGAAAILDRGMSDRPIGLAEPFIRRRRAQAVGEEQSQRKGQQAAHISGGDQRRSAHEPDQRRRKDRRAQQSADQRQGRQTIGPVG